MPWRVSGWPPSRGCKSKGSCDIRCKGHANLRQARVFFRGRLLDTRLRDYARACIARERRETLAEVQQENAASGGMANTSRTPAPLQLCVQCDGVRTTQSLEILLEMSLHQAFAKHRIKLKYCYKSIA